MATEESFLAAIAEDPEEEVHRLVFADWLEENNLPEQSELVRVECELMKIPEQAPSHLERGYQVEEWREKRRLLKQKQMNLLYLHHEKMEKYLHIVKRIW